MRTKCVICVHIYNYTNKKSLCKHFFADFQIMLDSHHIRWFCEENVETRLIFPCLAAMIEIVSCLFPLRKLLKFLEMAERYGM